MNQTGKNLVCLELFQLAWFLYLSKCNCDAPNGIVTSVYLYPNATPIEILYKENY